MKILVFGAKGFVGSRVVSLLEKKGYNVHPISEDIREKKKIEKYFFRADIAINCAGQVQTVDSEVAYYSSNILGVINIAELCLENECKLVHISSIETKGAYGASKRVSEILLQDWFVPKGLKLLILKLCVIMEEDTKERQRHRIAWCQVDKLAEDIERIVRTHPFNNYELRNYKEMYEEPLNIHQPGT
jgi:nucleoside-diphosphate-sugar epimerase